MVTKKNAPTFILIFIFISLLVYAFIGSTIKSNSLNSENVLYSIGTISKFEKGAKVSPWFIYSYKYKNTFHEGKYIIEGKLRAGSNEELREYIGKKFIIKISIENPKWSELYFDKPIPKNLKYEKGQTWNKLPI